MTEVGASSRTIAVQGKNISKEFPGVRALKGVDFSVFQGEIHALCGENGAGKSTLMKILSGLHASGSYEGELSVMGEIQHFKSTTDSIKAGIAIIYQELSLVPEMTIAENIFLGREPSTMGWVHSLDLDLRAKDLLSSVGLHLSPTTRVRELGVGQKQLIEIAKALSRNPKILILDEPTSALAQDEIQLLLGLLKKLKSQGVTSILISHKLDEVFAVSDRITILRDGATVMTLDAAATTPKAIISAMVGREIEDLYPKGTRKIGEVIFEVKNLTADHRRLTHKKLLDHVSFSVRRGEIVGFAGLMGSGRTDLLMALFGAGDTKSHGEVWLEGKRIDQNGKPMASPAAAVQAGLALATEDRKRFGLVLENSVRENLSLSSLKFLSRFGLMNNTQEASTVAASLKQLRVKTSSPETPIKNLSGGNQQKVILAKWLLTQPKVLFLDEPTRGIDIGAKAEIYQLIFDLAAQGLAIVLVSSELPEVLGMSDRIFVMHEGAITEEISRENATQERVMTAATNTHRHESSTLPMGVH